MRFTKQNIREQTLIELLNRMLKQHTTSISEKELYNILTNEIGIKLIIRDGKWARAEYNEETHLWE